MWLTQPASAGRIAVDDAHGEADAADEAAAFTLLIRSALDQPEHPVVPAAELDAQRPLTAARAAKALAALPADHLILTDVQRSGVGLRASLLVLGADGGVVDATTVRAGDGDVRALADGALARITAATGVPARKVARASLGQLRPYIDAQRAARAGRAAAAAEALQTADPSVARRVSAARERLRAVWTDPSLPLEVRLSAARAAGTPRDVLDLAGQGDGAAERAARAGADLATADLGAAAEELDDAPKHAMTALARAALANERGDNRNRDAALREALAGTPPPEALAFAAALPRRALADDLERSLVDHAARVAPEEPRLASALGLRAAEAGVDVDRDLALVSVAELDDDEVERLRPLLAARSSADALRLRAELALREGDAGDAAPAVDAYLGAAPSDPRAHLYKGRLLAETDNLTAAAAELERAGAVRERARVLLDADQAPAARALVGAPGEASSSVDERLVAARVALAEHDTAEAVETLREAEAISPANPAVQRELARALAAGGEAAPARAAELLADRLEPRSAEARAVVLAEPRVTATVAQAAAIDETARPGAMLDELDALLDGLPALPLIAHGKVVLVPLAGESSWLALRTAQPDALRAALVATLGRPARGITVVPARPAPLARPLRRDDLDRLVEDADAALLYGVTADGDRAQVDLVLYDRETREAMELGRSLPAQGLVAWNSGRIVLLAVAALALFLIGSLLALRGRGDVEVRLKTDPATTGEVFCIEVSPTSKRPEIPDVDAFRASVRRAGHSEERRRALLVGPVTRFRLPVGRWYVHLYGVYERAGESRVLDPTNTQEAIVRRGRFTTVNFDLVPTQAELRITIYDDDPSRVALWLDDRDGYKVHPDQAGEAVLFAPPGEHTLHVEARGIVLHKPFAIGSPKLEKLGINIERERRLAEVSEGLTLQRTAVAGGATAAPAAASVVPAEPVAAAPAFTPAAPAPVVAEALRGTRDKVTLPPELREAMAAPDAAVGDRLLGRYKIVAELGRGAMGVVFRAWDENLEREVAVKVLARELRQYKEAMTFFVQEAKALAQLNHPNIVSVYDQTADRDETYLIMEFVDGRTLEHLVEERGRFPWQKALGVVDQLCAGLAYAHARKVIHRDIKPANVFVSSDGVIKLGDFGLARVLRELSIRKTEIRGTPLYMAPEQITGTNIDHRADLYAVGCTLFELVTGRPPFIDGDVLYHHMHSAPPRPSDFEAGLPAALDDLVLACIAKDAQQRIASAAEIRERLRAVMKTA